MTRCSDTELIELCLEGNKEAWAALIGRYKQLIYSVPLRYRLSPDEAGDVFQTVCLELYTCLPKLREQAALRGWLATVAAHQSFQWKRRARRYDQTDPKDGDAVDAAPLPAEIVEQVEREETLQKALNSLSPRCRDMMRLLFFEDPPVPYAEVAGKLGLATGSIGFIRGRCLEKLRKKLQEMDFH